MQRRKVNQLGEKTQTMNQKLVSILQMSIFGIKETKVALKEHYFISRFQTLTKKTARLAMSLQFVQNLPTIMVEFITLSTILITFIALVLFFHGIKSAAVQVSILIFLGIRFIPLINRTIVALGMINSSIIPSNDLLSFYKGLTPEIYTKDIDSFKPIILFIAPRKSVQESNIKGSYAGNVGMSENAAYGICCCS